jgi:threonine dehydratase
MSDLFTNILEAHLGIRPQVAVTPLERSTGLSAAFGCDVFLKHDQMQSVGSFKIRGATNKIRCVSQRGRPARVLTASTGNHGLAAARAGALAGVGVTVYVHSSAVPSKMAGIRALGAELVVVDGPPIEAELAARRRAEEEGLIYISPYNDLDVIAGQGTLGVELLEQQPDLDAVFIAVGGGGLIGGVGTAVKARNPRVRLVGVWPEASPCMLRSLEAGKIIPVEEHDTLSDATAGAVEPGSVTFPLCQAVIDEKVSVSEAEIASAMRQLAMVEHVMVEGAAGVALAGLAQRAQAFRGRKVAVVLCGRNIELPTYIAAVSSRGETTRSS